MEVLIIKLENLFLDPNNYRLRSHPEYRAVDKNSELKPAIQTRTFNLIAGTANYEIHDLIESMKANGYLRVDNILVRKHDSDLEKYIVIEGNRRLAALKVLQEQNAKGYDIGKFQVNIFEEGVEVVLCSFDNEVDYLILMGLKHVSGNKKWDTYNQAKLLNQLKSEGYSEEDIAKKVGISKPEVERQIRGYHAIDDFIQKTKSINYGEYFNPYDKFMIFVELTNKPKLRKWVGWDEDTFEFKSEDNKNRFYSWITPKVEYDDETNKDIIEEPIISSHKQVRQLEEIIEDEESLSFMEDNRDFSSALNQNMNYSRRKVSKTIEDIERVLLNIPFGSTLQLDESDKTRLSRIKSIIDSFIKNIGNNEN